MPLSPSPKSSIFTSSDFVVRSARLKEVSYKEESDSDDDLWQLNPEPADAQDRFVRQKAKASGEQSMDNYQVNASSDSSEDSDYFSKHSPASSDLSGKKRKRSSQNTQHFLSPPDEPALFKKSLNSPKRLKQAASPEPVIKQEAEQPAKKPIKTYILEELNPDAFLLSEEVAVCTIDDNGAPSFSTALKPGSTYLVRRNWDQPAENAHEISPLQDFKRPGYVIKALQDPQNPGFFMPGIRIKSVTMSPDTRHNHAVLLKNQSEAAIATKESAIQERLQAMVDRSASDKRSYDTHPVTLNGQKQYGLCAREDISTDIRKVAKQDWSYKGFFYDESNQEEAENYLLQRYGPRFQEYVREIPKWKNPLTGERKTCYLAALGSGGHMHNSNTVLKKKEGLDGYLDYDLPKINLAFEDYTVVYELPNGQTVAYPHVEQAPMPDKKIKAGDELCVNYGPGFLNMLRKKIDSAEKGKEVYIKQEAVSDDEYGLSGLSETTTPVRNKRFNPFASPDHRQLPKARSNSLSSTASSLSSFQDSDFDDAIPLSEAEKTSGLSARAKSLKAQLPSLTKDWENVSDKENALAAAQMRIDHPDWSQGKIVQKLKEQDIITSQNSLSRWGISPKPSVSQEQWDEARMLKEQLPSLTPKWLSTIHREKANTAARIRLEHPDWNQPEIVAELQRKGFNIGQQSLSKWGIQSKRLTDDTIATTARLKEQLPYLTNLWINARQRKEANVAAEIHLQHPDWTSARIQEELQAQNLHVTDQTLRSWGIAPISLVSQDDMDQAALLKEKLPHLKPYWVNAKRRKEANAAAELHLQHPDWTSARIRAELKKQQMDVTIPTLVSWGISATRNVDSKLLEEVPVLKQQLPHLTSFWMNAHQREKANAAAKLHLKHPDWIPAQLTKELKKQGITIAPTTLQSWGISPRHAAQNVKES